VKQLFTASLVMLDAYKMLRGEREGGREAAVIRHPHSLLISYV